MAISLVQARSQDKISTEAVLLSIFPSERRRHELLFRERIRDERFLGWSGGMLPWENLEIFIPRISENEPNLQNKHTHFSGTRYIFT